MLTKCRLTYVRHSWTLKYAAYIVLIFGSLSVITVLVDVIQGLTSDAYQWNKNSERTECTILGYNFTYRKAELRDDQNATFTGYVYVGYLVNDQLYYGDMKTCDYSEVLCDPTNMTSYLEIVNILLPIGSNKTCYYLRSNPRDVRFNYKPVVYFGLCAFFGFLLGCVLCTVLIIGVAVFGFYTCSINEDYIEIYSEQLPTPINFRGNP
jgi:hypothetical protein